MGYGGATWDTAGPLTLSSDNTFNVADATVDGDPIEDQAWWTYTPTNSGLLSVTFSPETPRFVFYKGDDEATKVQVNVVDFIGDYTSVWPVQQGIEYHLLCGRLSSDPTPTTYQFGASLQRWAASPWSTTLQDDPNNYLIISGGTLLDDNPSSEFWTPPDWFGEVIDLATAPGRHGEYTAVEVLGGSPVSGAIDCCIQHARNGDIDNQSWNNSTTGSVNDGAPTCRASTGGLSTDAASGVAHESATGSSMFGAFASAEVSARGGGIWLQPVRENLAERGVLSLGTLDPAADGVPAAFVDVAELEWDPNQELELVKVEITIDDNATAPDDFSSYLAVGVNIGIRPTWQGAGEWFPFWPKGQPPGASLDEQMADGITDKPTLVLDEDPDRPWVEYVGLDDWSKAFDKAAGEEPDIVLSLFTAGGFGGWSGFKSGTSGYGPALKVTVRSPRYRWVYPGPITVVRQYPRDDSLGLGSATRLYPPPKRHRLAGGYQ